MTFNTTTLTYGFLYLTVILLWAPKLKGISAWWPAAMLAILFGVLSHRIELLGLSFVLVFGLVTFLFEKIKSHQLAHILLGSLVLVVGALIGTNLFPGFHTPGIHNLKVLSHVQISHDGIPFRLYLNIDKVFVGIFILGFTHQLISARNQIVPMLKRAMPLALGTIFIVMILSFALGYVHFDPKLPNHLLLWSTANLLFVCLAEEGFFRGFIQKNLCLLFSRFRYGDLLAIAIASVLFGFNHHAGGVNYMILATVAGMGYGFVYYKTKRIEASMLTHFLLNLTHILFFTYPALASTI